MQEASQLLNALVANYKRNPVVKARP